MKFLIWLFNFILLYYLKVGLEHVFPISISMLWVDCAWILFSYWLCKWYDVHAIRHKAKKAGLAVPVYLKQNVDSTVLKYCNRHRGDYYALKNALNDFHRKRILPKKFIPILLRTYMNIR